MQPKHFVAFDLGATSGRTILGSLRDGELVLKELTRFPNTILPLGGHYYWNIFSLYEHLCEGLRAAAREGVEIASVGIDTWGVDFAFVGKDGSLLGLPYAYRDPHTDCAPEEYFSKVLPREEVYGATGIQIMQFNSLYQLYAMQRDRSSQLAAAERLLFMPDALSYLLTGEMVTEYTIASTSQLLNPRTKRIEARLLEKMGLSPELFPPIVMPGHRIGTLRAELAAAIDKINNRIRQSHHSQHHRYDEKQRCVNSGFHRLRKSLYIIGDRLPGKLWKYNICHRQYKYARNRQIHRSAVIENRYAASLMQRRRIARIDHQHDRLNPSAHQHRHHQFKHFPHSLVAQT